MLSLSSFITPESVKISESTSSQKKAFELLAELLTPMGQHSTHQIFDALVKREKLGSTAIGNGVAIPHARVESIAHPKLALLRTAGVNNGETDAIPVSLFFGLIVPTEQNDTHLGILAELSRCIKESEIVEHLLASETTQAMYNVILNASDH